MDGCSLALLVFLPAFLLLASCLWGVLSRLAWLARWLSLRGVPFTDFTGGALGLRLLMALVLVGVSRDKNSGLRG